MIKKIFPFLADTWWYGMSSRITENELLDLAKLRVSQGFDAVQLVVGIPPEVGPENRNANSEVGFPWDLNGEVNLEYLNITSNKIRRLNEIGLKVIVYGAWGQQIDWLGTEFMKQWWSNIVKYLDGLDVIYCVTGESDLWIGDESKKLLPNKSTESSTNILKKRLRRVQLFRDIVSVLKNNKAAIVINPEGLAELSDKRKNNWSEVLELLNSITQRPIIIHPVSSKFSYETVNNPELLDAVTTQSGHDSKSRDRLWQDPQESLKNKPELPFINLEPWYEGILNNFYLEDQVFALWASLMSGATSFCYGAHGIWNVGDGKFLSQWGTQTFQEAKELRTPELLGKSFSLLKNIKWDTFKNIHIETDNENLKSIKREDEAGNFIIYYPEIHLDNFIADCIYFDSLSGKFVDSPQGLEQIVCLSKGINLSEF